MNENYDKNQEFTVDANETKEKLQKKEKELQLSKKELLELTSILSKKDKEVY